MASLTPDTYDKAGPFGPRGLILTGLSLHFAALLGLWQLAAFYLSPLVAFYLARTFFAFLLIVAGTVLITRWSWQRNSWSICSLYLIAAIISLAWIPALFLTPSQ